MGDRIIELLKTHLGEVEFADLDYPLYIGATDFKTGKNVALSQGKLTDAIRASISVPVLFSPYYHPEYDQWLVDGGLSQTFPLDLAIDRYQGDQIIGIDVIGQINPDVDFSQSGPSIPPIDRIRAERKTGRQKKQPRKKKEKKEPKREIERRTGREKKRK